MLNSVDINALKRQVLFTPCESKEALKDWIEVFLDLDIPDSIVDPQSTSSPMDALWEIYQRARLNDDPTFSRVLTYAARDSFKTLSAAIIEVLMVLHLRRNVAHMAAIKSQAKKAQSYVKKFFGRPFLRDFKVGDSVERTEILRYEHVHTAQCASGCAAHGKEVLSKSELDALPVEQQDLYAEIENYIVIIVATMTGTNSEHVPFLCVDEVDVLPNPAAYEEAKMIPAPINGQMPITLLTSTRKFSFGLVQKEIDNALDEKGREKLKIRHWNLIDVTQKCPPSRHQPDKPRLPIYRSNETLRSMGEADYNLLSPEQQKEYVRDEGYHGCLHNCRIFAACKGLLATKQKSTSKLLKPVEHTQNQFGHVSVETAKAQLLCWKPSTVGLIYPRLDRDIHLITPTQMAYLITGEKADPNLTKAQLVEVFRQRGCRFSTGMDFGYTHLFAAVTAAIDNNRCFIFDVVSVPEIETVQKIELCDAKIKQFDPRIWADTADPGSIRMFKKAGYRMMQWKKEAGSVVGGIEVVRSKLMPAIGQPELFFLRGDPGCELLFKRMSEYHWTVNAAGDPEDIPDDTDDDECDAMRYLVMNEFKNRGRVLASQEHAQTAAVQAPVTGPQSWMSEQIQKHLGNTGDVFSSYGASTGSSPQGEGGGRRGSFIWNLD